MFFFFFCFLWRGSAHRITIMLARSLHALFPPFIATLSTAHAHASLSYYYYDYDYDYYCECDCLKKMKMKKNQISST